MLLKASRETGEPLLAAGEPAASMPKTCSASRQSATASASSPHALLCRPHSRQLSIFLPCHALRLAAPVRTPSAVRGKIARMPHSLHMPQRCPHAGRNLAAGYAACCRGPTVRANPPKCTASFSGTCHLPSCFCMPG